MISRTPAASSESRTFSPFRFGPAFDCLCGISGPQIKRGGLGGTFSGGQGPTLPSTHQETHQPTLEPEGPVGGSNSRIDGVSTCGPRHYDPPLINIEG